MLEVKEETPSAHQEEEAEEDEALSEEPAVAAVDAAVLSEPLG